MLNCGYIALFNIVVYLCGVDQRDGLSVKSVLESSNGCMFCPVAPTRGQWLEQSLPGVKDH